MSGCRRGSEQMVTALSSAACPLPTSRFPDEGHGFVRPKTGFAFYGVTVSVSRQHLGGRYQPIGNDLRVHRSGRTGGELVPGISG